MRTLGIDFGTSTTRVAIRQEPDLPVAISIGNLAAEFIPSVVAIRREGSGARIIAAGDAAANLEDNSDVFVADNIKRLLMYRLRPHHQTSLPD